MFMMWRSLGKRQPHRQSPPPFLFPSLDKLGMRESAFRLESGVCAKFNSVQLVTQGRGHSMMPEQRNQNNDGDGNPKQPEQRSSSKSHDDLLYSGRRKLACHQIVPRGTHSLRIWPRKPDIGSSAGQAALFVGCTALVRNSPHARKNSLQIPCSSAQQILLQGLGIDRLCAPILAVCADSRQFPASREFFPAPRASRRPTSPAMPPATPAAPRRTPAAGRSSRDARPPGSRHAASRARSG